MRGPKFRTEGGRVPVLAPHAQPEAADDRAFSSERWAHRAKRKQMYIAMALVAPIVVVLPIAIGIPSLSVAGVAILLVQAGSLLMGERRDAAPVLDHLICGTGLAAVAFAIWHLALPSVIAVYFTIIILLGIVQISGVRAALLWAVPGVALVVASVYVPGPAVREVGPEVIAGVRVATLLTILGFGVRARVDSDRKAIELMRLASVDRLTGLANRRSLEERLGEAGLRCARHHHRGALLFLDLDGLKQVNDSRGHRAGDALIQIVAQRIQGSTRRTDTAARLGGDEFVVLLGELRDGDAAERVARGLVTVISQPFEVDGDTLVPSVSIGVVNFGDDRHDPQTLIAMADAAMYEAKRSGRNRVVVYRDS